MKKNRFLVLIALVLVCALIAIAVVGCQKTGSSVENNTTTTDPDKDTNAGGGGFTEGEGNTSGSGTTYNISNADPYISFKVKADSASDIKVTNAKGDNVAADIKAADGIYTVWAPNGGYEKGRTFKIILSNGATFVDYEGVDSITFVISNTAYDVVFSSGFLTYPVSAIQDIDNMKESEKTDGYGVTTGQMVLQINSANPLEKGTIFLIQNADGTQAAYKVVSSSVGGMSTGNCLINYEKPSLDEVFEEFDYSATSKMTADSNVDFDYMNGKEALTNSELAMSIFSMFGSAPEFDISVPEFDKDGHVVVDITITIPNVVQLEGYASTGLVITVHNVMDVEASANIDKSNLTEEFALSARVYNDITTTVSLDTDGGYTGAVNIPELMDKLAQLANDSEDDATAVPLFKWTVPIANGAATIAYNADLMFRFNVAGSIDAVAHANLDYEVGVMYTKEYGLESYAQEIGESNGIDSVDVSIEGMAELKIGLRQDLSFDILAGVLGIGIEAEIGNYNRLYGYGESSNLVDAADDYFVGGAYFVGGFYYDVNLSYGIKIGSLLNLADKVDIADGEIQGYDAGERYLVLGVSAPEKYTLSAINTEIPAIYEKSMYDLVTGERFTEIASAEEFSYVSNSSALVVENNVLTAKGEFSDVTVTATYVADNDLTVDVKYSFSLADPVLVNDTAVIEKNSYTDAAATLEFEIRYNGFANEATKVTSDDFTLNEVERTASSATISVPVKELLKLVNGMNALNMKVGDKDLTLNLNVTGSVKWNQFPSSAGYEVFTADQVLDMINSNVSFDNTVITVTDDIDMNGAEIAPIATFNGTLQGNGHKIGNYTVKSFKGEKAGFVAVNNGTIDNIVFAGNVNLALEAYTGKDYAVAGIAAVNNGTISNCAYTGNVNVYSYGLAAFVEFDVAAVTALNNGTLGGNTGLTGDDVFSTVNVTVKFDLSNVDVRIGDMTSTTKEIANIALVSSCENCANGGPWATDFTIAK